MAGPRSYLCIFNGFSLKIQEFVGRCNYILINVYTQLNHYCFLLNKLKHELNVALSIPVKTLCIQFPD